MGDTRICGAVDMSDEQLVCVLLDALQALDAEAVTSHGNFPTGLRWYSRHLGIVKGDPTEDAITAALADRLVGASGVHRATTQVGYPLHVQLRDGRLAKDSCDLVLDLSDGRRAWIEVKCAWPYLRNTADGRPYRNGEYSDHLTGTTNGAAADFHKLRRLRVPCDADLIGVLLVGCDMIGSRATFEITDADQELLSDLAGLTSDAWDLAQREWPDPHAARVFGEADKGICRTRCFLWLRGPALSPLTRLAGLLRRRNALDGEVASLIGRPAEKGHLGEFIAARVFDIDLHTSAAQAGSDGTFRSGPLAGRTVNVKLYGAQDGLLDVATRSPPDSYVVLTGPTRTASNSRGATRPVVIEHVFVFSHEALVAAGVRPGTAASLQRELWEDAQVFPTLGSSTLIPLTQRQHADLAQFASEPGASHGS